MNIAVVGSGISGIAAAHSFVRAGAIVELIERDDTLGGRFGVTQLGERPVMLGGKNIGRHYCSFRRFVNDLGGAEYEEFGINSARVKDGRLRPIDSGRVVSSLRNAFAGARPRDIVKLVRLARAVRSDEANQHLGGPLFTRLAERHDDAPLSAHFGRGLTEHLLRPVTVRMNGAEPDEVYLGTLGTNLALVLDNFDQLTKGIQPLLTEMGRRVTVRSDTSAASLMIEHGRVSGLRLVENGSAPRECRYDAVVLAIPAPAAAELVRPTAAWLADRLAQVRYFPTTVALVEYDRPVFSEQIRALAMDDGPCSNAGAYGKTDRHIVRYTFSGRDARTLDPSIELVDSWIDEGEACLQHHLPAARGATRVRTVWRHWRQGYCGYLPYHGRFLADVHEGQDRLPGLALAGDYLLGASIEACFRSGARAAATLLERSPSEVLV